AHLARHARHFGRERVELLEHRVHHLADAQEFTAQRAAVDFDRHRLGKVPLVDRADHARYFRRRLDHVVDQLVDRADRAVPAAPRVLDAPALADLAFLADDLGEPFELLCHLLVQGNDFVEEGGDLAVQSVDLFGKTHGEVAAAKRAKGADELAAIDKVPRGLDIHWLLRGYSPPPVVDPKRPPGRQAPMFNRRKPFTLYKNAIYPQYRSLSLGSVSRRGHRDGRGAARSNERPSPSDQTFNRNASFIGTVLGEFITRDRN